MNTLSEPEIWADSVDGLSFADKIDAFKSWIETGVKNSRKQHKPAFVYTGTRYDLPWLVLDSGEIQAFIRQYHIKISDDLRGYDRYCLVARSD